MLFSWAVFTFRVIRFTNFCCVLRANDYSRIAGGIGAVVSWIPIKAYRPCPNFINRGGQYQRSGQGLDEIAFGRDSTFTTRQ
jgi:hypothetical protein